MGAVAAAAAGNELALGRNPALRLHFLEVGNDAGAGLRRQIAALAGKGNQLFAQSIAVDLEGRDYGLVHWPQGLRDSLARNLAWFPGARHQRRRSAAMISR